MAVVKMHQAKDGSLHKTAVLCAEHNIQLRLAPAVDAFVEKLTPDNFVNADEVGPITGGVYIDLAKLPELLVKHSAELRKLYNDSLIERKPRKKDGEAKPRASRPAKTPDAPKPTINDAKIADGTITDEKAPSLAPAASTVVDPVDDILADLG